MTLIMKAKYFDKKKGKAKPEELPDYISKSFKNINNNMDNGIFDPKKHACVFKCLTGYDIYESIDPYRVIEVDKLYRQFTEHYNCNDNDYFIDKKFDYHSIDKKFIIDDLDRYIADTDLPTFREIFELSKFFNICVWYFLCLEY